METEEKSLHEKFVMYGANAKAWMRKCVLLLPEIEKREIWKKKGFGSIYEYAAKLAGMSRGTVDDALRILEKIQDKPNLRLVAEYKGLGAVRPVVTLATPEDEKFWAQKAAAMSKNTLETYVREYKTALDANGENNSDLEFRPRTETIVISMNLDRETAESLQKLKGNGDWNALMRELLALRKEKLEAEEPVPVLAAKRYIPARIKRHVLQKTNGQCAFPGCAKPYQILHHTRRFALRPAHDSKTLAPLCEGHERLAHHGLIERETEAPEKWRLKKEPDAESLAYKIDRRVMEYRKSRLLAARSGETGKTVKNRDKVNHGMSQGDQNQIRAKVVS